MPTIPFNSPYVSQLGFKFDFVDAFSTTATALGIPVNTSFSTLQTSLGADVDVYPTQPTAWGRANQAYTLASSSSLPVALEIGQVPVWNGSNYAVQGVNNSLRLGTRAGENTQGGNSVAVGTGAGRYTQGASAVALGFQAGQDAQSASAVAIGDVAGRTNQGQSAIAIGSGAGYINQHANSIILNASGTYLNSFTSTAMYVKPIRRRSGNSSWLTYDTITGELNSDDVLPPSLGNSSDAASLTSSVWAYAKQAEVDAQTSITWISTATTANANGELGTPSDTVDSLWGRFNTLTSNFNGQYVPDAVGGVGTVNDIPSLTTSLWALAKQAENDAQTGITDAGTAQTAANSAGSIVGTAGDTPSLVTTCFAYAKQAELDAQNASMSWDFEGSGLGHTTTCVLPSPYQWTTAFQHIWTLTATIPANWVGRTNTFISLFMWNTFATNTNTLNYFDYSINGSPQLPLGKTSATRPFTNGGLNQLVPITGNLTGVSLAPGDVVVIRFFGKVATGTHTMTNPTETGWGVFTTAF